MASARTLSPGHQRQGFPTVATRVRTTSPGTRLGWRQWLCLWYAERRRERLQRLDDLWDAQHEQVWERTADSHRDFIIQHSGPGLRLAIYHHLALS